MIRDSGAYRHKPEYQHGTTYASAFISVVGAEKYDYDSAVNVVSVASVF